MGEGGERKRRVGGKEDGRSGGGGGGNRNSRATGRNRLATARQPTPHAPRTPQEGPQR